MFELFSPGARKAVSLARQESDRLKGDSIRTEHLLLGIMLEGGLAAQVLKSLNVDSHRLAGEIGELGLPPATSIPTSFSPRAVRAMEQAREAAEVLGAASIGAEHLLLALLKDRECVAAQALARLGHDLEAIRDLLLEAVAAEPEPQGGEPPLPSR